MILKTQPVEDIQQIITSVHDIGVNGITREIYLNGDLSDKESNENIE